MIIDVSSIILFITFLCNLTVGIYVSWKCIDKKLGIIFGLLCLQLALWNFDVLLHSTVVNDQLALFFTRLALLTVLFAPSTFLYFTKVFIEEKIFSLRKLLYFFLPVLMFPFIFTSYNIKGFSGAPLFRNFILGELYMVYGVYLAIFIGWGVIKLIKFYNTTSNLIRRNQAQYIVLGILITASIGITTNIILPLLGIKNYNVYGTSASIILAMSSGYAITRYRLFDIKFIAQKWLLEAVAIVSAITLALVIAYVLTVIFSQQSQLLFTIIFIASYIILERYLRHVIVKTNHQAGLDLSVPDVLTFSKDVDETLQHLHTRLQQYFQDSFQVNKIILCVLDLKEKQYQSVFVNPMIHFFSEHVLVDFAKKHLLVVSDELVINMYSLPQDTRKELLIFMKKHHIAYAVPLVNAKEVYGFIFIQQEQIGYKNFYSKNQLDQLARLGQQYGQSLRDIVVYEAMIGNKIVSS